VTRFHTREPGAPADSVASRPPCRRYPCGVSAGLRPTLPIAWNRSDGRPPRESAAESDAAGVPSPGAPRRGWRVGLKVFLYVGATVAGSVLGTPGPPVGLI